MPRPAWIPAIAAAIVAACSVNRPPPGTATLSDPATCVDSKASPEQVAELDQTEAALAAVKRELDALGHCADHLPASAYAAAELLLDVTPDGGIERVQIVRATLTDCRPLDCVRSSLTGRRLAVSPTKGPSKLHLSVRLRRGAVIDADGVEVDERLSRPDTPKTCADPSALSGEPVAPGGRLPPAVIQHIVRGNYGVFRRCYESALARDPRLAGRVMVRFEIGPDGRVTLAHIIDNTLPDCDAARCVRDNYLPLVFPRPSGGKVTVVYPIMFSPG